ncbi:MAG: hypothetical protein C0485_13970 [Pirellula sp.]|nr:hypothetical protein [Pirellula sp.]
MKSTSTMMSGCSAQIVRRAFRLLCASAACIAFARSADAQATSSTILRWQIEATVIQIDDPDGNFPQVRLGDPVHGTLTYNLAIAADAFTDDKAYYTHAESFRVAAMIIDNPRTGESLTFVGDAGSEHDIHVYNDNEYDDEVFDYFLALQSVLLPPGVEADWPVVSVELTGPVDVIQDYSLPLELALDDWPQATISFNDLLGDSDIYAEIYSLTPVVVPMVSGDFDFDGDVDGDDLLVWQDGFGFDDFLDADGDKDLDVDGADYLIWQRNLRATGAPASVSVPEPEAAILFACVILVWWVAWHLTGKRRASADDSRPVRVIQGFPTKSLAPG